MSVKNTKDDNMEPLDDAMESVTPALNEAYSFITEQICFPKAEDNGVYSALERDVYAKLNKMREGDALEREAYHRFKPFLHNENYGIDILCEIVESKIKEFYDARAEGMDPFDD